MFGAICHDLRGQGLGALAAKLAGIAYYLLELELTVAPSFFRRSPSG